MNDFESNTCAESSNPGASTRSSDELVPPRKTILIIDDDEPTAFGLGKLLERNGFRIRTATHGRRGLQVAADCRVDLVITDIFMAEMEGLETIMELRRSYPELKVIAMSGGSPRVGIDCLRMAKWLGANAVLAKPVKIKDLLLAINCLELEGS